MKTALALTIAALVVVTPRDGFEMSASFDWISLSTTPPTPPPKSLDA